MDLAKAFSDVLPPLMHDPVMFAVPFFLLLLIIEWAAARKLARTEAERPPSGGGGGELRTFKFFGRGESRNSTGPVLARLPAEQRHGGISGLFGGIK